MGNINITKEELLQLGREYIRSLEQFKGQEYLKGQDTTEMDYLDLIICEINCSVARLKIY